MNRYEQICVCPYQFIFLQFLQIRHFLCRQYPCISMHICAYQIALKLSWIIAQIIAQEFSNRYEQDMYMYESVQICGGDMNRFQQI